MGLTKRYTMARRLAMQRYADVIKYLSRPLKPRNESSESVVQASVGSHLSKPLNSINESVIGEIKHPKSEKDKPATGSQQNNKVPTHDETQAEIAYPTVADIKAIHTDIVELTNEEWGYFAYTDKVLESAIDRARTKVFGVELFPSLFDKASAMANQILQKSPFLGKGNVQSAFMIMVTFLLANGVAISDFSTEAEKEILLEKLYYLQLANETDSIKAF